MFKFSKNFFLIFLLCTIIPLLFMYVLHNYKNSHHMEKLENSFLKDGYKQLKKSSDNYLTAKKNQINNVISNLKDNNISSRQYKNILKAEAVYFLNSNYKIPENIPKIESINKLNLKKLNNAETFYDLIPSKNNSKEQVVTVTFIPLVNQKSPGIIVIQKVNFKEISPNGPFDMVVFAKDNIDSKSLLIHVKDPFSPMKFKNPDKNHKTNNNIPENTNYKTLKLINSISKSTVCTIYLKMNMFPPPQIDKIIHLISIIIIIIALLISIYVGYYIKNNFITPVLLVSDSSKKAMDGDFSSSINYKSKSNEINETLNRFNNMLKGLEEKEQLRNNFITCLMHDLKTPLIANERGIELLLDDFKSLGLNEQTILCKGMKKNNTHLLRMINLLIESYRFNLGNIYINKEPINLYEMVTDCYNKLQPLTQEKNISLINNISKDFRPVKADKDSMNRVFLNLIGNSIDNIQDKGMVKIETEIIDSSVKIIVEDNGSGISEEDQKQLFNKFYIGQSIKRQLGSGLGLYICNQLIELNNGTIQVESTPGQYTRFTILLPQ